MYHGDKFKEKKEICRCKVYLIKEFDINVFFSIRIEISIDQVGILSNFTIYQVLAQKDFEK